MKNYWIPDRNKDESNADYTYRVLRQNILKLNLTPGEVINEKDWADLLSESRTPVHEAINRLETENLCVIIPRKESRISKISLSLVNEGLFVRCNIEPALISSIAGNLSKDDIAFFRQNLERQRDVLNNESAEDRILFFQYDDAFHKHFYYAANKAITYRFVSSVCGHFDRVRYMIRLLGEHDLESSSYKHHCNIFQMLCFGVEDRAAMEEEYRYHISAFGSKLALIMEKYPEYFMD